MKNRRSIISGKACMMGGRLKTAFRVYTLGEGADAALYFSLRLWQAAAKRQQQLACCAAAVR